MSKLIDPNAPQDQEMMDSTLLNPYHNTPPPPQPSHPPPPAPPDYTPTVGVGMSNNNVNVVSLAVFNQVATQRGFVVSWQAESTGPPHQPTWTVRCCCKPQKKIFFNCIDWRLMPKWMVSRKVVAPAEVRKWPRKMLCDKHGQLWAASLVCLHVFSVEDSELIVGSLTLTPTNTFSYTPQPFLAPCESYIRPLSVEICTNNCMSDCAMRLTFDIRFFV